LMQAGLEVSAVALPQASAWCREVVWRFPLQFTTVAVAHRAGANTC
jgi:hypothetical protein